MGRDLSDNKSKEYIGVSTEPFILPNAVTFRHALSRSPPPLPTNTGGEGSLTQWVHYEFIASFEAIRPVITQQVCGEPS